MSKLLSKTNSKLKVDGILSFGLPPVKTCPAAGECLKFCYGCKGMYKVFKKTIEQAQNRRLEATKDMFFFATLNSELRSMKKRPTAIRIHDTGDFYSQEYFDKWVDVASSNPDILFYAYTKSLHLDFSKRPSNLKLIGSVGGKYDSKLTYMFTRHQIDSIARIFEVGEPMTPCHVNVSESDSQAIFAVKNRYLIGIYKH